MVRILRLKVSQNGGRLVARVKIMGTMIRIAKWYKWEYESPM